MKGLKNIVDYLLAGSLMIVSVAVFMVTVIAILSILRKNKEPESASYDSRRFILTPAELAFYKVLRESIPGNLYVISKVRIADVLSVRKGLGRSRWQIAQNKINSKHVDFVLCNSDDMQIVAAVELDDSSHNRADRRERDDFVESAFQSAELPLIRFKAKRRYDSQDVASTINSSILLVDTMAETSGVENIKTEQNGSSLSSSFSDEIPKCPKCTESMMLRTSSRGTKKGTKFWGCSSYPKCRAIVNMKTL